MKYPQLPIFAFLAAFLVLIPLPSHWRAQNVATLALIFWLFITNVVYGVNSIKWAGNVKDVIPVWCDITTKLTAGSSYALPLCTLCICKHLEMVSSSRKVSYTHSDRRRRMIFESIMCFLVPCVFMALHYIVQGHRYDIIESIGCQPAVYISLPAILIIYFPQLLFSFITLIYASLALHNFMRRRLTFASHLQTSNSALTTNRYVRLIAMALMEMIWGTLLTSLNLQSNVKTGLRPWKSWADVHSNFGRVGQFPTSFLPERLMRMMWLFWWSVPVSGFIFFIFFGFGEEAVREYRRVGRGVSALFVRLSNKRFGSDKEKGSFEKSPRTRQAPRPLKLAPSSTMSALTSISSPSSSLRSSQSTVTLTAFSTDPHTKKALSSASASMSVASPTSTETLHAPPTITRVALGRPIDASRDRDSHAHAQRISLPRIDSSDAFSISSFSYYEPTISPSISGSATTPTSTLVPSYSPRLWGPEHSLPPPPPPPVFKEPRAVGSLSSLFTASRPHTYYAEPDVPHDVGPSSYTLGGDSDLPLSRTFGDEGVFSGLSPLTRSHSPNTKVLGVKGGGIVVTVQRQASVDGIDIV